MDLKAKQMVLDMALSHKLHEANSSMQWNCGRWKNLLKTGIITNLRSAFSTGLKAKTDLNYSATITQEHQTYHGWRLVKKCWPGSLICTWNMCARISNISNLTLIYLSSTSAAWRSSPEDDHGFVCDPNSGICGVSVKFPQLKIKKQMGKWKDNSTWITLTNICLLWQWCKSAFTAFHNSTYLDHLLHRSFPKLEHQSAKRDKSLNWICKEQNLWWINSR